MKLAVAQIRPEPGPVEINLPRHIELIELAIRNDVGLLVFPELSLTGYEPAMAAERSRRASDPCFGTIQSLCDQNGIAVGFGLPLLTNGLPNIATLLLGWNTPPRILAKRFLHQDELPFFTAGDGKFQFLMDRPRTALAICYELSVAEHTLEAFSKGCTAFVASAAKDAADLLNAIDRLSEIAKQNSAVVMLANCTGTLGGTEFAGRSTVWNRKGEAIASLDSSSEGLIVIDHDSEEVAVVPV